MCLILRRKRYVMFKRRVWKVVAYNFEPIFSYPRKNRWTIENPNPIHQIPSILRHRTCDQMYCGGICCFATQEQASFYRSVCDRWVMDKELIKSLRVQPLMVQGTLLEGYNSASPDINELIAENFVRWCY